MLPGVCLSVCQSVSRLSVSVNNFAQKQTNDHHEILPNTPLTLEEVIRS